MNIKPIKPGKYIVAVSGGVDSVSLLHVLTGMASAELIVAHFDHGIRPDSSADADFVKSLAQKYEIKFELCQGNLGPKASEADARQKRYEFLRSCQKKYQAVGIITAHHQNDLIETAVINLIRGTKRRGLVSLQSDKNLVRPLLDFTKDQLIDYAKKNKLVWREDPTNTQDLYLRNRIRKILNKNLNDKSRLKIILELEKVKNYDLKINKTVQEILEHTSKDSLPRNWFLFKNLQMAEAYEILAGWLKNYDIYYDQAAIRRLYLGIVTLQTKAQIDISGGWYAELTKTTIVLNKRQSV